MTLKDIKPFIPGMENRLLRQRPDCILLRIFFLPGTKKKKKKKKKKINIAFTTLHVGAGTFKPVKVRKDGPRHEMHAEWMEVSTGVY